MSGALLEPIDLESLDGTGAHLPELVVYEHINWRGADWRLNLNVLHPGGWNDRVSSIVIISGQWQFFSDANFGGNRSHVVGPGYYPDITSLGLPHDTISSFKCVSLG